jgi:hypothetical protein
MFDRFSYLADNLLKRSHLLETALEADRVSQEECERRREELVARVMVFEAGIGDPETIRLVMGAIPRFSATVRFTEEEFVAMAKFLRDAIPLEPA